MNLNLVLLSIHNLFRWIVLLLFVVVLFRAYWGWFGKRTWEPTDRVLGIVFTSSLDIQLLLGLILIFTKGFGALESFIQRDHILSMFVAVILAHVASALSKRGEDDILKYRRTAIWTSIAFIVVLVAIPWSRPLIRWF